MLQHWLKKRLSWRRCTEMKRCCESSYTIKLKIWKVRFVSTVAVGQWKRMKSTWGPMCVSLSQINTQWACIIKTRTRPKPGNSTLASLQQLGRKLYLKRLRCWYNQPSTVSMWLFLRTVKQALERPSPCVVLLTCLDWLLGQWRICSRFWSSRKELSKLQSRLTCSRSIWMNWSTSTYPRRLKTDPRWA